MYLIISLFIVFLKAQGAAIYIFTVAPVPMLSLAINSNFVIKASNITRSQTKFEISSALSLQPDLHSFAIFIAPFKLTRQIHLLPIWSSHTRINPMHLEIDF